MENNDANPFEKFETPHLFLLIGTNPLPNYVAAKLIWKREQDAKLCLVYSPETRLYAKQLKDVLKLKDQDVLWLPVDKESDIKSIYDQVSGEVTNLKAQGVQDTQIGLNYTGGTKAMAVHAYKAIQKGAPGAVMSYLDARTLSLKIERQGQVDNPIPTSGFIKASLEDLLALHDYTYKIEHHTLTRPKVEKDLRFPELARTIGEKDLLIEIREWAKNNYRRVFYDKKLTVNEKESEYQKLPLPDNPLINHFYNGATTVGNFAQAHGENATKICLYFDGDWLEEYSLLALKKNEDLLDEYGMDVKPVRNRTAAIDFQIDDYGIKGYQLFAISCGTGNTDLKLKLFEVLVRARQIGGDEAHIALVCGSENPGNLEQQLVDDWNLPKGLVKVYGVKQIPELSSCFRCWICGQ